MIVQLLRYRLLERMYSLEPCLNHGSVLLISQFIIFSYLLLRHVDSRLHFASLLHNNDVESVEEVQTTVPTTQLLSRLLYHGSG